MKIDWMAVLFAFIISCIMFICVIIQQHMSFGEEAFNQIISPIGFLAWGSSFCIALIFWYFVIDFIVRHSKSDKVSS